MALTIGDCWNATRRLRFCTALVDVRTSVRACFLVASMTPGTWVPAIVPPEIRAAICSVLSPLRRPMRIWVMNLFWVERPSSRQWSPITEPSMIVFVAMRSPWVRPKPIGRPALPLSRSSASRLALRRRSPPP